MLVFEDRFTNKAYFKKIFDLIRITVLALFTVMLILALTNHSYNSTLILLGFALFIMISVPTATVIVKRLSIDRLITFNTDGKNIDVLMGKSRVAKLNIPVSIQKGTGLETYFTNGSMTVRRLFVTDGEEILVIGEEIKSSTMENFDSKSQPSDLFAQNPGTLDKLEIALSKYLRENQNTAQSSMIFENPIP